MKKTSFQFPEYYSWSRFFTIQLNDDTKSVQFRLWQELISKYSEAKKIHTWGVTELFGSELCYNKELNRRLTRSDFDVVLEYMIKSGKIIKKIRTRCIYYVSKRQNHSLL